MSIYLAPTIAFNSAQTAIFKEKKLINQTKGPLKDVKVFATPTLRQIAYDGYIRNFDAFIYATAVQQKVLTTAPGYHFTLADDALYPIQLPMIAFNPNGQLGPDEVSNFRKLCEGVAEKTTLGRNTMYTIRRPTIAQCKALYPFSNTTMATPGGCTSLQGAAFILTTVKILTAALSTR
jgi:hypothetical protein